MDFNKLWAEAIYRLYLKSLQREHPDLKRAELIIGNEMYDIQRERGLL